MALRPLALTSILFALLVAPIITSAATVTFDDCSAHFLSGVEHKRDAIKVADGQGGCTTTLTLSGEVGSLEVLGSSIVSSSGWMQGTGTEIDGEMVSCCEDDYIVWFREDSVGTLDGGRGSLLVYDNAHVTIQDGQYSYGVNGPVQIRGNAEVEVFGGDPFGVQIFNSANLAIYGTDLNLPYGDYTTPIDVWAGDEGILITGTSANGTPLNHYVEHLADGATLTLAVPVPEPSTDLLFGAVLIGLYVFKVIRTVEHAS